MAYQKKTSELVGMLRVARTICMSPIKLRRALPCAAQAAFLMAKILCHDDYFRLVYWKVRC